MATNFPERNHALPTLDALIKTLDIARSTCGVPPARAAFASVGDLLAIIMVHSLASCDYKFPIRVYLGQNGQ